MYFQVEAQNIYQAWVFMAGNNAGQIEFIQKDKKIIFRRFEDFNTKTFEERIVELEIVETIQEKGTFRFIVQDPENDNRIGLLYCYGLSQEQVQIFALQNARSVEYAKSYEAPENMAVTGHTWARVEKITQSKNPEQMSKEDALYILKSFKEKLEKLDLEDIKAKLESDSEVYFFQILQGFMVEKGYNIFATNPIKIFEVYESDEAVKKLMDEIKNLTEGEDSTEESIEEGDDGH